MAVPRAGSTGWGPAGTQGLRPRALACRLAPYKDGTWPECLQTVAVSQLDICKSRAPRFLPLGSRCTSYWMSLSMSMPRLLALFEKSLHFRPPTLFERVHVVLLPRLRVHLASCPRARGVASSAPRPMTICSALRGVRARRDRGRRPSKARPAALVRDRRGTPRVFLSHLALAAVAVAASKPPQQFQTRKR